MATAMAYSKDGAKRRHGELDGKDAQVAQVRKKLKTSDLPLASATRAAIEGLAHTFKKKGGYDSLRKQVWEDLVGSVSSCCFSWRKDLTRAHRILRQILHALYLTLPNKNLTKIPLNF